MRAILLDQIRRGVAFRIPKDTAKDILIFDHSSVTIFMMANLSGRKCIGVPGPWGEKEARQSERINKNVF